ncbi:aminoglycoside phosphotransferase family protein [Tissierella sp. MB52-C2]|uniref:phosphotransferase family protein n=1 Tax=Tissierella sp. MB52-C2 TaxID=3070999 RepID=UPI00280B0116|nr:aminoglycoside phosphotransferase family protein [Tissierella sp. MB52-C2]WMM24733.1 aminoglycoside phosphotransferase family protein [Tissierella sp. MB52-C2]
MVDGLDRMRQPEKWRETIDPFSLKFNNFYLEEILGYPHAGNDVFYVKGIEKSGEEITAFLKVERQKTADTEREVSIINKLDFPFLPNIIDYSFNTPKYILTEEAEGNRLSYILGDNKNMESLKYMNVYGELLAKVHNIKIEAPPVKKRDFTLSHKFYLENNLEYIEQYLLDKEAKETKCFIHGDCHYGNILWKDYKVSCLLDYELSGYGSREYDLAWSLVLRPGQKFLRTAREREVFLESYGKYHKFSKPAFDYYMVLFGIFFYSISLDKQYKEYRIIIIDMIKGIISNN